MGLTGTQLDEGLNVSRTYERIVIGGSLSPCGVSQRLISYTVPVNKLLVEEVQVHNPDENLGLPVVGTLRKNGVAIGTTATCDPGDTVIVNADEMPSRVCDAGDVLTLEVDVIQEVCGYLSLAFPPRTVTLPTA